MPARESLPTVEEALAIPEHAFVRCKSVCTLTPGLCSVEALVQAMDAGVTAVRIQAAKFDQQAQMQAIQLIKDAKALRPQHQFATLLEVRGGELSLGAVANKAAVALGQGQTVQLVNSEGVVGDSSTLTCAFEYLPRVLSLSDKVYFNDGAVVCQVTEVLSHGAALTTIEGGEVREGQSIAMPASPLNLPPLTSADEDDITQVVQKLGVDFIVLNQVRSAAAVERVKAGIQARNLATKLLVKLQNVTILEELEAVFNHCDGVVICAFDLGLVVARERMTLVHEAIIAHGNARGKPVLLLSDRPARHSAPSVRLQTTVIGTDVVIGMDGLIHPPCDTPDLLKQEVAAFQTLCQAVECSAHYRHHVHFARSNALNSGSAMETVCAAAVQGAANARAKVIVAVQGSDFPLSHLLKFRPMIPVVVVAPEETPLACLLQGCVGFRYGAEAESRCVEEALEAAKKRGLATTGSRALVLSAGFQNSIGNVKVTSL